MMYILEIGNGGERAKRCPRMLSVLIICGGRVRITTGTINTVQLKKNIKFKGVWLATGPRHKPIIFCSIITVVIFALNGHL